MRFFTLSVTLLAVCLFVYPLHASAQQDGTSHIAANGALPNDEGIVMEVLDTTGYTYMELQNGDRRFWIAAPTTQVKPGDHVRFVHSMSMENFTSKTLNRTFRHVIFVSTTMIKK